MESEATMNMTEASGLSQGLADRFEEWSEPVLRALADGASDEQRVFALLRDAGSGLPVRDGDDWRLYIHAAKSIALAVLRERELVSGEADISDTHTTYYVHAEQDVADILREQARQLGAEAELADARAKYPEQFGDERLVAAFELTGRLGWRFDWFGFNTRERAIVCLRACIADYEVETERERLQFRMFEILLAELERKP